ncbi:MAG: hypothetical protein N4A46_00345, partial [Schleiferiaceae bacterium]|nr:hypothetical protein [Schleiferiaceae bacterium]
MFFLFKNNRIKHLAFILALFVSASLLAQEPLNAKKQQKFDAAFFEAERFKVIEDFDQAILKYEECLKISPNHPVVLYELAGLYFIDNRNEVALNSASKAVQLDSLNAWYRLRLIKILQVEGNRAEVINQQKILIDQNPNRLDFIFQLAETYLIDLQYQNCIDLLTEAERLEGITEDKSTRKRDMYLLLNDADKAREEIEKLVEAYPTNVNYLGQLANFYSDYGPEQKVEPTYLKLIEMAPEDPRAYLNLASYYRETGRNEESIFYLKSALVTPNLNVDAKISVLMSLNNLDPKDTAMSSLSYALLDSTLKAHPEDPKIYTVYSDFLVRDGKDKEALTYLRKAVKLGATQRQILEQLILLDMEAQDFEAMSKDAEMAMEYYP